MIHDVYSEIVDNFCNTKQYFGSRQVTGLTESRLPLATPVSPDSPCGAETPNSVGKQAPFASQQFMEQENTSVFVDLKQEVPTPVLVAVSIVTCCLL